MPFRMCVVGVATASLMTFALLCQAAPAHYYRWQGDSRIVCAQTSPGPGWTRLKGHFVKSDCSI
ncbi:hypothetical protein ALO95_00429 [Pseudomonas syringae pv. antirrhini]|uniref:Secreted protein n=2 Tax=Pseudomonas syringae group TaxID=136849 RepID=A0A0P9JTN7_9PSED|nr:MULTISPECIES: hypothetical protein [Pseudomonas]KPW45128.1 Uncharacterized protein ALO88_03580 [Pseudomonas syringae pv. antirrhini]RMP35944.1 hypothetical protein ALQ24_04169 [Pseudomonas syringae pv. antirrhini]RMP43564.1 hypothetical protein ALQ23_02237 [Pseudomonas syringae pv. antirrhini]RMW26575.1 hypothetical protein ALO95_00429 [Pseudomonas syringae pv. antirrhini]WIN05531.1 hypothetical protein QQF68_18220 [Pseudomonas syringae pv. antirrhini str. 126]